MAMGTSEELEGCKRQLAAECDDGRRAYSGGLRERVRRYVRGRLDVGSSARATAAELGLPWKTIARWLEKENGREARAGFLRVDMQEPATAGASPVVLYGPHGVRLEGADAVFVAALLRALA